MLDKTDLMHQILCHSSVRYACGQQPIKNINNYNNVKLNPLFNTYSVYGIVA